MKSILQYVLSGLVGFVVAYSLMKFSEARFPVELAVIGLIAITILLIIFSFFRMRQIKTLNNQHFTGDEEDKVEERKYKMFVDYSLCANVSFILSILAFCFSMIAEQHYIMTAISFGTMIISMFLIHYMARLMQIAYPERNFPLPSDRNYTTSVLDLADDGEKHVILNGLYKSQNLLNVSLIFAIALATIYSINNDDSQIFSIGLMAVVMLLVNGSYLFAVRNK